MPPEPELNCVHQGFLADLRAKAKQLEFLERELATTEIEALSAGVTFEQAYRAQHEGKADAAESVRAAGA